MRHPDFEQDLTRHIIELREKMARMESEVAHLADGQAAHTGSLVRTDQRLAHIAQSLRDAHLLIERIQLDVQSMTQRGRVAETVRDLAPAAVPAMLGLLVLALTLTGKSDLARQVLSLKP